MENLAFLPEARRAEVRAALRDLFGAQKISGWQLIEGGVSGAPIFRFDVREHAYVLRIEPERIALNDRQRGYACMQIAAAAGAAPPVHYADPVAGIAVMDFVTAQPLALHPGGAAGLARALGKLLARLHTTPLFPSLGDYPKLIGALLAHVGTSELFAPARPDQYAEGLARIEAALRWHPDALVSSHNDPNPRNILFDGENVWLIDWELGFRNDPLVDVPILTTELAETPELEDVLLTATFGAAPTPYLQARLHLIRLLARLCYGCIVLDSLSGRFRPAPGDSFADLTPLAFRAALADGSLAPGSLESAYAFAKMSLTAFRGGLAAPEFERALRLVRDG